MKERVFFALVFVGAVAAAFYFAWRVNVVRPPPSRPASTLPAPHREVAAPNVSGSTATPGATAPSARTIEPLPAATASPAPAATAVSAAPPSSPSASSVPEAALLTELEEVQTMLREYRTALGENPVGANAEIMRAVTGDNLKQTKLRPPEGQRLNDAGELIDRWGTPYFFHQVSRDKMEVRSAGPDREMWTGDDLQL